MRRLATLHALTLFSERRFDLAVDAFIALDVSPAKVVALYAEPISGKLFVEVAAREELFGGRARDKVRLAVAAAAADDAPAEGQPGGSPARKPKIDDDDTASVKSATDARLKGSKSWLRDLHGKPEDEASDGAAEKAASA